MSDRYSSGRHYDLTETGVENRKRKSVVWGDPDGVKEFDPERGKRIKCLRAEIRQLEDDLHWTFRLWQHLTSLG